jgi:DNA-binding transcriptional ArsR family regulator
MDPFAALADPVRRGLLEALAGGPARVVDLAAVRPISRPAVSRHLRVLGEAGLVEADEVGRERHYRLRLAGLAPVTAWLDGVAAAPRVGPERLDALDLEVRRTVRARRADDSDSSSESEETA